jgi:hypothetical protein
MVWDMTRSQPCLEALCTVPWAVSNTALDEACPSEHGVPCYGY